MHRKNQWCDRRGDGSADRRSTALLTIYDMCKAVDKGMELGEIHLVEKTGGKSGHYIRAEGGYV